MGDVVPLRKVDNTSGIEPTEFKVLIDPFPVEEITQGGIVIPDEVKDKERYAQTKGRIIAKSPLAFYSYASAADWDEVGAKPPEVGDVVLYVQYEGRFHKGVDGHEYIIINDNAVIAVANSTKPA